MGVVDISGPAMTLHPAVQSLVTTAVRLAEARLMIAQQEALNTLRDRMSAMLAGTSGPALVVDDAGWVAYQQGVRSRDRIEVPAGYDVTWDMTSLPSPADGLPVTLRPLTRTTNGGPGASR